MRAAAIFGLGCSAKDLKPFQTCINSAGTNQTDTLLARKIEWDIVMPGDMPSVGDSTDVILLFGGDGTIHRHLGQLVTVGVPVLVVPAGSGNDFARALGLRRVRDSLAAWRKFCEGTGNVHAIDLGVINSQDRADEASALHVTHYFACAAGVGLDAEVSRRANQLPRWLRGHGGYALSLLPTIFNFAPLPMKIISADDSSIHDSSSDDSSGPANWVTRIDRPTLLAAFANTPHYGGGMKIAPQAKMDDGLLDACVIGGIDPFRFFCMFPTVYYGRHLKISEVSYFQAPRVRVETEHPVDVFADGEYVCQTPVEFGVQRAALKIVIP